MLIKILTISFMLMLCACSGSGSKTDNSNKATNPTPPASEEPKPSSPKTVTAADMVLSPLADANNVDPTSAILVTGPVAIANSEIKNVSMSLKDADGTPVEGELKAQDGGVRFVAQNKLKFKTRYDVFFAINDGSMPEMKWSFTTQKDPIPLTLEVMAQSDGTVDINTSNIKLKLSKRILNTYFKDDDFILVDKDGNRFPTSARYNYDDNTISIIANGKVQFLSEYKLNINRVFESNTGQKLTLEQPLIIKTGKDTVGPKVSYSSPYNSSSRVSVDSPLFLTFDEPLNKETIKPENFVLKDTTNNILLDFTLSLIEKNTKVTITPNKLLNYSSDHTLILTSDITDLAGNPVKAFTLNFETLKDNTRPKIVSVTPENNAINLDVIPEIIIEFDKNIENSTINSENNVLRLYKSAYSHEKVSTEISVKGNQLIIKPAKKLFYSSTYTINGLHGIGSIKDKNGNTAYSDFKLSFKTKAYSNKIDVGVAVDSFKLNKANNKLYALNSANSQLIIIDLDLNQIESTHKLTHRPSRLCIDNDSDRLYITNLNVNTISEYSISELKKLADIKWSKENYSGSDYQHFHIKCTSNSLYVTSGNWNSHIHIINRASPYAETKIEAIKQVGGFELSSNGDIFLWGGHHSKFKRYQLTGEQWSLSDESLKGYSQNEVPGRDALVFIDEGKNRVFNHQYVYNAYNLKQTFHEFGENDAIYAVDFKNQRAASLASIYSLEDYTKIESLPTPSSDGVVFDNDGDVYMIDNSESSIFYLLASDIGAK